MEALSNILQPYTELIGTIAGIVTTGQIFSGAFVCLDVKKRGNTHGMSVMPFVGGLVMSLLSLRFGFIIRNDVMIRVNFLGLALNIAYIVFYYAYTHEKGRVWTQLGAACTFAGVLIGYTIVEQPELVEQRFGIIITMILLTLISLPLLDIPEIIRKKSSESIPFPIVLSGTVVTSLWLLYGIALKNKSLIFQNILGVTLVGFQLALTFIYPARPTVKSSEEKSKKSN